MPGDALALDLHQGGGGDGFDDAPVSGERGCDRIDFLFVIDNSISMVFAQNELLDSFPDFMEVVRNNVAATDYHIMVVDTDGWNGLALDFNDERPIETASIPHCNSMDRPHGGMNGRPCALKGGEIMGAGKGRCRCTLVGDTSPP